MRSRYRPLTTLLALSGAALSFTAPLHSQPNPAQADADRRVDAVMSKVVSWRRDIHEHPELSGFETRTAALVAEHLRSLGMEVRTDVGGTGVVGVLRGGRPGPVVALRADMDALPVTEINDLPFRSRVRAQYNGQEVGVMHACGHDNHVAILMGTAEVLAGMREQLAGTVKFIFQPAEEGHPDGGGGAERMIRDGALSAPNVDVIFGLHVWPGELGQISYRPGPTMAAENTFRIVVHGKQTHGANPWRGIDPIVISSQVVLGLQTIVSRQTDITAVPAIVTVGAIQGGVRSNIIPDSVVLIGTIRTFERQQRADVIAKVIRTAEQIAASGGARAAVVVDTGYPVTRNDSSLTERMLPTLVRATRAAGVRVAPLATGAEDFSYFQERVPGLFVFLGITPADQDWRTVPVNHSPLFFADEGALPNGVRVMTSLTLDYLANPPR